MNNYPIWWDQTLTVFNKYEDTTTRRIVWYKTVLTNCFWKYQRDKIFVGNTTLETNYTICRIPKNNHFVEAYQFNTMSSAEKSEHFTFSTGDIIIKGDASDVIIDEYISGIRSSDIIAKYKKLQGCMVIEQCSIDIGVGRCSEHYLIKGV